MSRYPDDMDDDAILIPVDVSGEEETFPTTYEELVEKAIFFCKDDFQVIHEQTWGESVGRNPPDQTSTWGKEVRSNHPPQLYIRWTNLR